MAEVVGRIPQFRVSLDGGLLRGVADAVLALYGYPEPEPETLASDVADLLHALAYEKRKEAADD